VWDLSLCIWNLSLHNKSPDRQWALFRMLMNCWISLMWLHHYDIDIPMYLDLCVTILHVNTQINKYILNHSFKKWCVICIWLNWLKHCTSSTRCGIWVLIYVAWICGNSHFVMGSCSSESGGPSITPFPLPYKNLTRDMNKVRMMITKIQPCTNHILLEIDHILIEPLASTLCGWEIDFSLK
jgi:hypothetical protein